MFIKALTACVFGIACASCSNGQSSGASGRGTTIGERFPPPAGHYRTASSTNTFASFLGNLPLKPDGTPVHLFDGALKHTQDVHAAVLDMSVGGRDLQQCADALMRLRAEYLFATGRKDEITFNFTNGFKAPYTRWMKGERIRVNGNDCNWVTGGIASNDHASLLKYLDMVFTYAGTASLSKELHDRSLSPIRPGHVFIQGGYPGHAVIVLDVATNPAGEQLFLLAQSYMPAQEIHVLKNPLDPDLSPWFKLNDGDALHTPEWTFAWSDRKCWAGER